MDSYRGFGSTGRGGDPQASFVETTFRWQSLNLPSAVSQGNLSWERSRLNPSNSAVPRISESFDVIAAEAARAADRLPFHSGFEVSNGYGSNSGLNRCLGFPSWPRNSGWGVDVRSPSGFLSLESGSRKPGWRERDRNGFPPHTEVCGLASANKFTGYKKSKKKRKFQKEEPTDEGNSHHHSRDTAKKVDGKDQDAQNDNGKKDDKTVDDLKPPKKKPKSSCASMLNNKDTAVEETERTDGPSGNASGIYFSCKLCRFRTEDEAEVQRHFKNAQHVEIMRILYESLPRREVDFIKEFMSNELKLVSRERQKRNLEPQKYDFRGIGQEHYLHRIEAAHCIACDVLIPALPELLADHVKSPTHGRNRRAKFEETRDKCVIAARMLLRDKKVNPLLERYAKGDNPFQDMEEEYMATLEDLVPEEDVVSDCETEGKEDHGLAEDQEPSRSVHTTAADDDDDDDDDGDDATTEAP
ncbi:A-kinase anchor protein 8-like [Spea bombifrons]|uniref:A-kinase anchor protein 8-like n=1 Tax=Spea bombifrons TaxID=233779 RepID=UPI002349DDA4|nr:A-kinase anchor protein 8-like [Spea bombifrons]